MQTQPDLTARLATLNATLAKATKACPNCAAHSSKGLLYFDGPCECPEVEESARGVCGHILQCPTCQGTGEVARFPDFQQDCGRCDGKGRYKTTHPLLSGDPEWVVCNGCSGLGWQVRGGGMEDALAGLSVEQFYDALTELRESTVGLEWHGPAPNRDTILAKTLELVIEVVGLEVSPACAS